MDRTNSAQTKSENRTATTVPGRALTSNYAFRISLILAFLATQSFARPAVAADKCDWSFGKLTDMQKSARLKAEYEKIQASGKRDSCVLTEDFDASDRSLKKGALQAIQIAQQSCVVSEKSSQETPSFLFRVMSLQGLKLLEADKALKEADVQPSNLFWNGAKATCFTEVARDHAMKPGDLLITQSDALVVDSIGVDPFGIQAKVTQKANHEELKKFAESDDFENADKVKAKVSALCRDWVGESDATEFRISIFHPQGRSPLFPTYGSHSSAWVTALKERAEISCHDLALRELQQHAKRAIAKVDFDSSSVGLTGMKVLRHSHSDTCQLDHLKMPKLKDLDCVQACDAFGASR